MRNDISPNLVHFTRGGTFEEAYVRFKSIISQKKIFGSSEKIKGGMKCICFSEAPIPSLPSGLVNPQSYSNYSPFGFVFSKTYIYSLGGRPVIYQPDSEYSNLPPQIKWRHMRFELGTPQPIDFTWEREWRAPLPELQIDPSYTHLVFPNKAWFDHFAAEHHNLETIKVQQYSLMMPSDIAAMHYEPFKWIPWYLQNN